MFNEEIVKLPPAEWENSDSYMKAKVTVEGLSVNNYHTERGVSLCSVYQTAN